MAHPTVLVVHLDAFRGPGADCCGDSGQRHHPGRQHLPAQDRVADSGFPAFRLADQQHPPPCLRPPLLQFRDRPRPGGHPPTRPKSPTDQPAGSRPPLPSDVQKSCPRSPTGPCRHLILVQGRGHQRRPRLVASPIAVSPLSVHTSRTANRRPVHPGSQGGDSGALTLGRQPLPDNTRRCHWSAIGVDVVPVAVPDIRAGANSTLR